MQNPGGVDHDPQRSQLGAGTLAQVPEAVIIGQIQLKIGSSSRRATAQVQGEAGCKLTQQGVQGNADTARTDHQGMALPVAPGLRLQSIHR